MSSWQPFRPEHAIEIMAIVVTLHEPLPSLVQRRAFKLVEDACFEAGLRSRHVLTEPVAIGNGNSFSIQFGGHGSASSPTGYMFNAMAEETFEGEARPAQAIEQLEVRGQQIVYRTWRYVSWDWHFARLQSIIGGFLSLATDVVQVANVRCEYLDRFVYDGSPSDINFGSLLNRSSSMIAPHVFEQPDAWHSHTGASLSFVGDVRRIVQVHMDVADALIGDQQRRTVGVMTALEDRRGLEASSISTDVIFGTLSTMHSELKEILSSLISPEMAARIHLKS